MQFVSYIRVSTKGQSESGLGIDAQRSTIEGYISTVEGEIIREYVEIESGAKNNRVKLLEAMKVARRKGATLIVAKLDRLSRVFWKAGQIIATTPVVVADSPQASNLELQLKCVIAEEERRLISQRTKEGLAEAKKRGVELGTYGKVLAKVNQKSADAFADSMRGIIAELQAEGFTTIRALVEVMNDRKIPTARGGSWSNPTVHRLLKRLESL